MPLAEYTAIANSVLAIGATLPFTEKVYNTGCCRIMHRKNAASIVLRGNGRYRIFFNANLQTGADAQGSLAIAVNGEVIPATIMQASSGAAGIFNNVATSTIIDVPCNCCATITVVNNAAIAETVANANIIIEEVA